MYYVPLAIVGICAIIESKIKRKKIPFYIAFAVMSLFLILRYGQGTDYFGYLGNYELWDYHSEIGFLTLERFFHAIGCPFEVFAILIAVFHMTCTFRAINLYSPYKCFSLMLLYPVIYLTYYFSALRQGIIIAFFLGFMLKWLEDGKWIRYIIACIILATIHSVALMLLPIVVIKRIKNYVFYIGIAIAGIAGISVCILPTKLFSFIRIGAVQYYFEHIEISYIGLAERIVMAILIILLYNRYKIKNIENKQVEFLYKVYLYGVIVSIGFFPWGLLSSRLAVMMKATEIVLLPMLLAECTQFIRRAVIIGLSCYVLVMTTKNIMSYIKQGKYEGYNVISYPYITLWQKEYAREIRSKVWNKIVTEDWWNLSEEIN